MSWSIFLAFAAGVLVGAVLVFVAWVACEYRRLKAELESLQEQLAAVLEDKPAPAHETPHAAPAESTVSTSCPGAGNGCPCPQSPILEVSIIDGRKAVRRGCQACGSKEFDT